MSVSVFANALRAHSRLRVLTAARVALPATRSISSLVAFRTAIPKNVSLSVSRSFTTSQVARYDDNPPRPPVGPTIFIANIPWNATEEDLSDIFSEFGKILSVRLHLNSDGRPKGICHIEYSNKESAIAAVESATQEAIHMSGRDLRVDFSAGTRARAVHEPSEKLYFSGCAGEESEVRALFNKYADAIVDIHLLKDPQTGERTSCGFVQLDSIETATEAMETLQGIMTPDNEPLAISYARPRRHQPSYGFSEQTSRRGSGNFAGNRPRRSSPRY